MIFSVVLSSFFARLLKSISLNRIVRWTIWVAGARGIAGEQPLAGEMEAGKHR